MGCTDGGLVAGVEACAAFGRARDRMRGLQRALVLGDGDPATLDAALDAAVVAYRTARAAARWREPADTGLAALARFAGWLAEAGQRYRLRVRPAA